MSLTLAQKIKLSIVKLGLYSLLLLEALGRLPEKSLLVGGRIGLYIVLIATLLLAVSIENSNQSEYSLSYIAAGQRISSNTVLGVSHGNSVPVLVHTVPFPTITAEAAYVVHPMSGTVFYSKGADIQFPPASTTKLMTALVARDIYPLDQILKVPTFCTGVEGQKVGFSPDEEVSVSDLLHALLINSAGDAACTLASNSSTNFIELMNQKAADYNLNSTKFSNSIGLDDIALGQLSTARDLFTLSRLAMNDEYVRNIVSQKEYTFNTNLNTITVYNTNALLWGIPGSIGIKTGKTEGAGEVLIYEYRNDSESVAVVVMSSLDRFGDTRKILEWVLASYKFD